MRDNINYTLIFSILLCQYIKNKFVYALIPAAVI